MKLVDRYIVRQLAGPFLFFLFVFGGIIWLNQALRIVDVVVENGQPGMVFVELSIYLLPRVLESVFPVAAFAASLFLTNRLYAESEYAVMMAAGLSPLVFARPFIIFGAINFVLVLTLANYITPISNNAFQQRQHEIRQEYILQLVKVGEFITPQKGVTFYFGALRDDGLLEDILIREVKDPTKQMVHTAPTGRLIDNKNDTKLVLINGTFQQYDQNTRRLNVIKFDSFSYDLTQFSKNIGPRKLRANATTTPNLPWSIAHAEGADKFKAIEAQSRLVKSLFSLFMPLLGAAILFSGSFSRAGFYYRIVFAVVLLLGLNTMRGATQSFVAKSPSLSFLLYSPVAISLAIIVLLIFITVKGWDGTTLMRGWQKKQVST
ncbi:MAG: LPS export ABC transporter permease LptF [Proteobacteria bacterium]|nr:LPS export ABC transporter permease LptF [Pseudomonadota bacterium]